MLKVPANSVAIRIMTYFILIFLLSFFPVFSFGIQAQEDENEYSILNQADNLISAGNTSEAAQLLIQNLKIYKKSKEIPYKLGELFYNKEIYPAALKYFLLSYKRGKKDFYTSFLIADTYAYLNDNKNSEKWFKISLKTNINQAYTFYSYVWVLLKEEKYKFILDLIDRYYDQFDDYHYLDSALGVLYANIGEFDRSRFYYQKVLDKLKGFSSTINYNWGILEYETGNYEKALELYSKSYQHSSLPESYLALGEVMLNSMEFETAEQFFLQGIEKIKSPLILYTLFYLNFYKGDLYKAEQYSKKILDYSDQSWMYQYNIHINEQMLNHYDFLYQLNQMEKSKTSKIYLQNLNQKIRKKWVKQLSLLVNGWKINLMKKYYSFKLLKKGEFDYQKLDYYQRMLNLFANNRFFYLNILQKMESLYKKYTPLKMGKIYLLYCEYAAKFNDKKIFGQYSKKFLDAYDKRFEKLDLLFYYEMSAQYYYKQKDYENYFVSINQLIQLNPQSINRIDMKIGIKLQFFNCTASEKQLFESYFKSKKFSVSEKWGDNRFIINIEKLDKSSFSIYIINPFESANPLIVSIKEIKSDKANWYDIFIR